MESRSQQNKISQGTTMVGDINSEGGFRIEGTITGNINTPAKVVIGATGVLEGSLTCQNADVEGRITGKITVSDTLTLRSSAKIEGEVVTKKLAVEPGASFNASCVMGAAPVSKNKELQEEIELPDTNNQNSPFDRKRRSKVTPAQQAN